MLSCLFLLLSRGRRDVGRVCPRVVVAERLQECVSQTCCTAADVGFGAPVAERQQVCFFYVLSVGEFGVSCCGCIAVCGAHQFGVLSLR